VFSETNPGTLARALPWAVVAAVRGTAFAEPAPTSSPRGLRHTFASSRRIWCTHLVFWLTFLVATGTGLVRNRSLFLIPKYPWADSALNSLLVIRAEHLTQLVGNYSRVGFHHPGPALFYVLAAGEVLFRDVLGVVPSPYNGQLLGVSVYVGAMIALAMVSLYRTSRSLGATAIAFGLVFLFAARQGMFIQDWFPYLHMSAFLLFIVAGAGLAAGRTSEVPLYVLGASLFAHGHVSFLMFVGVTTAVVVASWWLCHRGAVRAEVGAHRTGLIGAAALLFILLLPLFLELAFNYPGPWDLYWNYLQHGTLAPRSLWDVLAFVGASWTKLHIPTVVFVLAGIVAVALTLTEGHRERRRLFISLYGMLILQTMLTGYYVLRGVDRLSPIREHGYVTLFYEMVPVVLMAAAAAQLWIRLRQVLAVRISGASYAVRMAPAGAVALLVAVAATNPALSNRGSSNSNYASIVQMLRSSPARAGRPVGLIEDQSSAWTAASGIGVQMRRVGLPWCLDQAAPISIVQYTSTYVCHGAGARWTVHATLERPPPRVLTLWSGWIVDQHLTLYEVPKVLAPVMAYGGPSVG